MTNPQMQDPALAQAVLELMDGIMAKIEPDLVSNALLGLDAKYANETDAERSERMVRYQKARALCDERVHAVLQAWKGDLQAFKHGVMDENKAIDRVQDSADMADIERSIQEL